MNKARQVVETWDRQFHCSPHDQRLAFLYLANDILQNSRRKGSEFVGEFWKVLPDALRDVIDNRDEFARSAALRLVFSFDFAHKCLIKVVTRVSYTISLKRSFIVLTVCTPVEANASGFTYL